MKITIHMSRDLDTAAVVIRVHWLERFLGRRNREFVAERHWGPRGVVTWYEDDGRRRITDKRTLVALDRAWWSADYEQRREAVARRVEAVRCR